MNKQTLSKPILLLLAFGLLNFFASGRWTRGAGNLDSAGLCHALSGRAPAATQIRLSVPRYLALAVTGLVQRHPHLRPCPFHLHGRQHHFRTPAVCHRLLAAPKNAAQRLSTLRRHPHLSAGGDDIGVSVERRQPHRQLWRGWLLAVRLAGADADHSRDRHVGSDLPHLLVPGHSFLGLGQWFRVAQNTCRRGRVCRRAAGRGRFRRCAADKRPRNRLARNGSGRLLHDERELTSGK